MDNKCKKCTHNKDLIKRFYRCDGCISFKERRTSGSVPDRDNTKDWYDSLSNGSVDKITNNNNNGKTISKCISLSPQANALSLFEV